jgi:hypothetical protein
MLAETIAISTLTAKELPRARIFGKRPAPRRLNVQKHATPPWGSKFWAHP